MIESIKKALAVFKNWQENTAILKWVINIGKGFKKYILGFLAINFLSMVLSLGSAIAGRYAVDSATGFKSEFFIKYIVIMFVTTVVSIIISMASNMFSNYVNEKFAFSVRAKMFDRVQRSIWQKVSQYHSGDMLSRLTSDIDVIASSLVSIVPNCTVTFLQLVIVLGILFKSDPTLAMIGLVVGPIGMVMALVYRKKYSMYQRELRETQSDYYSFFQESLANINVVKTFQMEDENNLRIDAIRANRMDLVIKSTRLSSIMSSLIRLVYGIGYVVAFSWCAYRLTTATTVINADGVEVASYTYGSMTLFLSLVSQVQNSIRSLGNIVPQIYSLLICAKRVREITELEDEDYSDVSSMPKEIGLRVNNASFAYDEESGTVLKNISFDIPAKKHIGIVGMSGAGKTTFIRMLLALVRPEEGTVEYIAENGEAEEACPASRRFISYVPQGNTLMSGTVRSNLMSADENVTEEQMWKALEMADAADFVKDTPAGLDTSLTEKAGGLSEGQAQRISIARALLRNRPVLILDEATSALDEQTEAKIFERITAECDKTCFIITHRRSMLKYCDAIIEIDAEGHAELK